MKMWEEITLDYSDGVGGEGGNIRQTKSQSYRLKVPRGWFVKTEMIYSGMNSGGASVHSFFIEDLSHAWKL